MIIFGITLSTSDLWLLGICGALLLTWVTYRFTIELKKREIFNNASKELIDTFHRELKEIYPNFVNWPDNIDHYLRARFNNLSEAVGKFKRHLPRKKQGAFEEVWFRFYCCTGREVDKNCQCYHHYMPFITTSTVNGKQITEDTTKTYKETFKHNVDNLLKYAKQI
jgi:hypothetical protein